MVLLLEYNIFVLFPPLLAAMHYNENEERPQAVTEEGVPLFKISFPKARKGECRVEPQKTQHTFGKVSNQKTHILI